MDGEEGVEPKSDAATLEGKGIQNGEEGGTQSTEAFL